MVVLYSLTFTAYIDSLGVAMPIHTRVPHDPDYVALVGTAVYVFAYYEWALIYLVEQYKPGFVHRYSRGKPLTSGQVMEELQKILADSQTSYAKVGRAQLEECVEEFARLINRRNALIHAHPITDSDGSQILSYQTSISRPLPDIKWPSTEVSAAIAEFDRAACAANDLLHRHLS